MEVTITVNGAEPHGRRRAAPAAGARDPRGPRPHGHAHRVRHDELRRVHRAAGRHPGEVVHDVRRPGRRPLDHDGRGPGRTAAGLDPIQAAFKEEHGLQCGFCTPGMMLVGSALIEKNPDAHRRRRPLGDLGSHLPLHRLHEHREGDPGRGARRRPQTAGPRLTANAERKEPDQDGRHRRDPRYSDTASAASRTTDSSAAPATTSTTSTCPGMLHMAILRSPYAHANLNERRRLEGRRRWTA